MKGKTKNIEEIPEDIARELQEDEESFNALRKDAQNKIKEGYRAKNLSDTHLYGGPKFKRSIKTGREQIICKKCQEVFIADINGDRILFEDPHHRLLMIKFKEIIAVCSKCFEAIRFSPDNIPDVLKEVEGKTCWGQYDAIKTEMELKNIKNHDAKIRFLKEKLLDL